jgi:zinc protease
MLDRKLSPPFSHSNSIELPSVQQINISKNVDLIYFDQVKQALVKIDFVFKAGKWYEKHVGLSHFTSHMLEKGTSNKSANEIAETFDRYGAQVEVAPGFDYVTVSLYSLSNKIREVLPLFLEVLKSPGFPQNELDLLKGIFSQNLKVNNEKNSFAASKIIRRNVFGESHPYGSSIEENSLNGIDIDLCKIFFESNLSPYEIYITGQLDAAALDFTLGEIKESVSEKNILEPRDQKINPLLKSEYLEKEESIQTSIRLGKRTVNKNHEDYFNLLLLNHILGGYFGSRLMKNIREEKGLSYGIYSSINTFVHDSFFVIGADVNKNNQELTINEIYNELEKLRTEVIPLQELEIARSHLLGSIQLDIANPFSVVEKVKNMRLNHLDMNHYPTLFKRVSEASSDDLRKTAQKYFQEEDLFVVKVG